MRIEAQGGGDARYAPLCASFAAALSAYRAAMAPLVRPEPVKVMLGDCTIADETTFDPRRVEAYYARMSRALGECGWDAGEPSATRDGDVRRIFARGTAAAGGGCAVSVHASVQFHALLYYRPEYRVVQCQKELSAAASQLEAHEKRAAAAGERRAAALLAGAGRGPDAGPQDIFEALYNDSGLYESVRAQVDSAAGAAGAEAQRLAHKKKGLLAELDSLLVETYRATDVVIDDARLVTGEEGIVLTVDVGPAAGGGGRVGVGVGSGPVPEAAVPGARARLDEIMRAVHSAHGGNGGGGDGR